MPLAATYIYERFAFAWKDEYLFINEEMEGF